MNQNATGHIKESGARLITYQDFAQASDKAQFCLDAVRRHMASDAVQTAQRADLYDHQMNVAINEVRRWL